MALVDPDGCLTLADGTKVNTIDGSIVHEKDDVPDGFEVVPNTRDAIRELDAIRRNIDDLPELPEKMNPISAVLSYHLFGLRDVDIAAVSGLSEQQVTTIRESDAFVSMLQQVVDSIYTHDSDKIRAAFQANAEKAANKVATLVESESDSIALAASKDMLDRGGYNVKQIIEHQHRMEGGLTIEVVHKNKDEELPTLELTATHVEGAD